MSSIKSNDSYTKENQNINNIRIIHHPEDTVPISIRYLNNISIPFHEYLAQTCPSLFGKKANYTPTPYLRSGHLQTMYASLYDSSPTKNDITYERYYYR